MSNKRTKLNARRKANAYLKHKLGSNCIRLIFGKATASDVQLIKQINTIDNTKYGNILSWYLGNGKSLDIDSKPKQPRKSAKKKKEDFLTSWEWTTLRYKVIQKYGRKCMCCGASPDDGSTVINVDHIKPRHTHPELSLDINNLQVLCHHCNKGKGAWDNTDFRKQQEK